MSIQITQHQLTLAVTFYRWRWQFHIEAGNGANSMEDKVVVLVVKVMSYLSPLVLRRPGRLELQLSGTTENVENFTTTMH